MDLWYRKFDLKERMYLTLIMTQEFDNECWRNISAYLDYQVSNIGRVRNSSTRRILKPCIRQAGGYHTVVLYNGKSGTRFRVHRLVAQEFIDNPEEKSFVDHVHHNITDTTKQYEPNEVTKYIFKI